MYHKLKLTPNPFKPNSITRVVVVLASIETSLVVDIDRLYRDSGLFKPINQGYCESIAFFRNLKQVVIGLTILSIITGHWWVIFVGMITMRILTVYGRQKVASFILASLASDAKNIDYYWENLLAWKAPNKNIASGG